MYSGNSDLYEEANSALIGRINYAYGSRYLLEAQFRYDGSSKFAKGINGGSSLPYQQDGVSLKNRFSNQYLLFLL